jgi:hypothetical protein
MPHSGLAEQFLERKRERRGGTLGLPDEPLALHAGEGVTGRPNFHAPRIPVPRSMRDIQSSTPSPTFS